MPVATNANGPHCSSGRYCWSLTRAMRNCARKAPSVVNPGLQNLASHPVLEFVLIALMTNGIHKIKDNNEPSGVDISSNIDQVTNEEWSHYGDQVLVSPVQGSLFDLKRPAQGYLFDSGGDQKAVTGGEGKFASRSPLGTLANPYGQITGVKSQSFLRCSGSHSLRRSTILA